MDFIYICIKNLFVFWRRFFDLYYGNEKKSFVPRIIRPIYGRTFEYIEACSYYVR